MTNSNDPIVNETCNVLAYSAVPQSTAPTRVAVDTVILVIVQQQQKQRLISDEIMTPKLTGLFKLSEAMRNIEVL